MLAIAAQVGAELQVLEHGELGEEPAPLWAVAHALGDHAVRRQECQVAVA
jgi:hypothetical protein